MTFCHAVYYELYLYGEIEQFVEKEGDGWNTELPAELW